MLNFLLIINMLLKHYANCEQYFEIKQITVKGIVFLYLFYKISFIKNFAHLIPTICITLNGFHQTTGESKTN